MRHQWSSRPDAVRNGVMLAALAVLVITNVLQFVPYATAQTDRWGFRPGQSDRLSERIAASGTDLLRWEWRSHLVLAEMVGDRAVLQSGTEPFDPELMDHLVDLELGPLDPLRTVTAASLSRALEGAPETQLLANLDGRQLALLGIDTAPPGAPVLVVPVRDADTAGGPAWVVAPEAIIAELEGSP